MVAEGGQDQSIGWEEIRPLAPHPCGHEAGQRLLLASIYSMVRLIVGAIEFYRLRRGPLRGGAQDFLTTSEVESST